MSRSDQLDTARRKHQARDTILDSNLPEAIQDTLLKLVRFLNRDCQYTLAWPSQTKLAGKNRKPRAIANRIAAILRLGIVRVIQGGRQACIREVFQRFGYKMPITPAAIHRFSIYEFVWDHAFWKGQKHFDEEQLEECRRILAGRTPRRLNHAAGCIVEPCSGLHPKTKKKQDPSQPAPGLVSFPPTESADFVARPTPEHDAGRATSSLIKAIQETDNSELPPEIIARRIVLQVPDLAGLLTADILRRATAGVEAQLIPAILDDISLVVGYPDVPVRDGKKITEQCEILHNNRVMSRKTWAAREELDDEVEQANLMEEGPTPAPLAKPGGTPPSSESASAQREQAAPRPERPSD